MTHTRGPARRLAAAASFALTLVPAGCTSAPPAERTVYVVREMPMVLAYEGAAQAPTHMPASGRDDDPGEESRRRAWIEETYFRPRVQVVEQQAPGDRYVPAVERPPERVIVVEREPSRVWLPPVQLSLGYWGGGGHHGGHGGWSWGLGWGFPLWGW